MKMPYNTKGSSLRLVKKTIILLLGISYANMANASNENLIT